MNNPFLTKVSTKCKILKALVTGLEELEKDFYDFHAPGVRIVYGAPSPMDFLRNFVKPNVPVLFKNAVSHWPALANWNYEYLSDKLQDTKISVAVTPNGYADAVIDNKFIMAQEKIMTFNDFADTLIHRTPLVYYIQKQDNNLIKEFEAIHGDVDLHIPWATEAMGRMPDAVNFWMGDERAVSSLHKDHYENIYCVVKGKKRFIMHPPIDAPWIPYNTYEAAAYTDIDDCSADCTKKKTEMKLKPLDRKVKWIPVDASNPDLDKYPLYGQTHQFHCLVEEGDVLYIPALWYHHVTQSHGCIAVNYWYDMEFDAKYCQFKFLEKMGASLHKAYLFPPH